MNKLVELVGKQASYPAVQAFLSLAKLPLRPEIPHDDSSVYLNKESVGLSALFKEADYVAEEHGLTIEGGAPILAAIFLFGPGDDDFTAYQGALLNEISFHMDRAAITSHLGPSVLFDEEFNTEAWDIEKGVRIFLDYDDARQQVRLIQVGLTPASWPAPIDDATR
ncbi:hypothetical protein LFL96_06485 [Paraburkholderia sp. D15]|uniref:hypothetical protein n=1 Tax=Paraburkholderia sp. D15 TaxID=2880218 RepID=UPI00247A5434|nr:hypothetical protein [Paraburkholderia sp. D15]WGS51146.1 hypothetical protein LFL96_06485 [Paraburkholderia sp. D15]